MPTTIAELLHDKAAPVTTRTDELLNSAVARMVEHDYSQLPVVDDAGRPLGILTADSAVRALSAFNVAPEALRVIDAMESRTETCGMEDELLDVLDGLRRVPALLVVDAQGNLTGIITNHDATEHFRLRVQDITLVEDIEETIKDYVLAAFGGRSSRDEAALKAAIEEITPSNMKELFPAFRKALEKYLELTGKENNLNNAHAKSAFTEHLLQKNAISTFEKLTLSQYIQLLLHKSRWDRYRPVFQMDRDAINRLLVSVLDTRNDLAHFRTDITTKQRTGLRQCRDWLSRHAQAIREAFDTIPQDRKKDTGAEAKTGSPPIVALSGTQSIESSEIGTDLPGEKSAESLYDKLGWYLDDAPPNRSSITFPFSHIDTRMGLLPKSAREHRSWWAKVGNSISNEWLVHSVDMSLGKVVFSRRLDARYLEFFERLLKRLTLEAPTVVNSERTIVSMSNVQVVDSVESTIGNWEIVVAFVFGRSGFRVELNISGTEAEKPLTKGVFDFLHREKDAIEHAIGQQVVWDRRNEGTSSRLYIVNPAGSIIDDANQLDQLQSWAVTTMISFWKTMRERIIASLGSIRALAHPEGDPAA